MAEEKAFVNTRGSVLSPEHTATVSIFPSTWQQSGQVAPSRRFNLRAPPTGRLTVARALRANSLLRSRTLRLTLMYSDVHRCSSA